MEKSCPEHPRHSGVRDTQLTKLGDPGGRENFSPYKGGGGGGTFLPYKGEGTFFLHKRGLSLEIHFEGNDLFSVRLEE